MRAGHGRWRAVHPRLLLVLAVLSCPALAQQLREELPEGPRFGMPGTQVQSANTLLDHPLRPPALQPPAWLSAEGDRFVLKNLSLGFSVQSGLTPGALARGASATEESMLFRVGYNLPVGEKLSLWLRVGAGLSRLRPPELARGESESGLALEASALLVYPLRPGVHLGVGPTVRSTTAGNFVGVGLQLTW